MDCCCVKITPRFIGDSRSEQSGRGQSSGNPPPWMLGCKYWLGFREGCDKGHQTLVACRKAWCKGISLPSWLPVSYNEGRGAEKDTAKAIGHWEAAALCGHVSVKFNLGCKDLIVGENCNLALQHWVIAAKLGDRNALNNVKDLFMDHGWSCVEGRLRRGVAWVSERD